jgi:Bacterial regulatory proteins, luxR family
VIVAQPIAAKRSISVATARTHVSRAMTKLHARDRAQLVVAAYESGLVTLDLLRAESPGFVGLGDAGDLDPAGRPFCIGTRT